MITICCRCRKTIYRIGIPFMKQKTIIKISLLILIILLLLGITYGYKMATSKETQKKTSYSEVLKEKKRSIGFKSIPEKTEKVKFKTLPMIAFSFDDGPGEYTGRLLDILQQNNVVATFFVLGKKLTPEKSGILNQTLANGNEIGNHAFSHRFLTKLPLGEVQSEITKTNDLVKSLTGYTPILLRPPYGSVNDSILPAINMPIINWSLDTGDWKYQDKNTIATTILNNIKDGDIILMHDIYPSSVDAIEIVLPQLKARGFQIVTVSQLYANKRMPLQLNTVYKNAY